MRSAPEVASVERVGLLHPQEVTPEEADAQLGGTTGDSASYLGPPTGLWRRLGGVAHAGEGVIDGNDLGVGLISGIAPRAYIAAYGVATYSSFVTPGAPPRTDVSVVRVTRAAP